MEDLEEEEAYIPENETKPTKLSITNYGFEEQKYELFCTLKKSIFDSIYSNAINYVLSPRNSSTQRISGCASSILWLQNESLLDRKELLGKVILISRMPSCLLTLNYLSLKRSFALFPVRIGNIVICGGGI